MNGLFFGRIGSEVWVSQSPTHGWRKAPRHPTIDEVIPGRTRGRLEVTALHTLPDGSVAVGYGDWGANTGGVTIYSLDPATLEYTQRSEMLATEAVIKFYTDSHGVTWAPFVDGTGSYEEFRAAHSIYGTPPVEIPYAQWIHVFDMLEFDGAYWLCGSGWHGGLEADPVGHSTPGAYLQRVDITTGEETRYYGNAGSRTRFYSMHVVDDALMLGTNIGVSRVERLNPDAGERTVADWKSGLSYVTGAFEPTEEIWAAPPPPSVPDGVPGTVTASTQTATHFVAGDINGDIWVALKPSP